MCVSFRIYKGMHALKDELICASASLVTQVSFLAQGVFRKEIIMIIIISH